MTFIAASNPPAEVRYMSPDGQWNADVERRLDAFIDRVERGEIAHPTAVFDFDGTLCRQDIGENFLKWQVANRKLQGVDYSRDIFQDYQDEVKKDHATGYAMCVRIMKGLQERDVRAWAADFAREHTDQHAFERQKALVDRLLKAGVDVWIVSASAQVLVEAAAPHLGIAPDHAIGIRGEIKDGKFTGEIVGPVTYRQGKVDAIDGTIQRRPNFASGNSWTDYEILQYASEEALMINPAADLLTASEGNGWAIQQWPGDH